MKKYALLAILMSMLLVAPAFAFWHPPPPDQEIPPCPFFGVLINGEWSSAGDRYEFVEPFDSYCDEVTVDVFIYNVTDLYGYEFELTWNSVYFSLISWTVHETWPSQFVVMPDATYDGSKPYKQVVAAMAPSIGVDGDFLLATLVFHIDNDVCWAQAPFITGKFDLKNLKASNSCSGIICLCDEMDGYWKFIPVQPHIWIDPEDEVNSKVGDKFTATVWLENITKMHDFNIVIWWWGFHVLPEDFYTSLLYTDVTTDVVINEEVFPAENSTVVINNQTYPCGRYTFLPVSYVQVIVTMDPGYPLINGTMWLFSVTFTKCDPWFCGAQPGYEIDLRTHEMKCQNASTELYLTGCLSVLCPDPAILDLYTDVLVDNGMYTFAPIPGDLDGNGHVDVEDIMIEVGYYGKGNSEAPWSWIGYYYDLNKDGYIDVYDVVIVAKNFCRTVP